MIPLGLRLRIKPTVGSEPLFGPSPCPGDRLPRNREPKPETELTLDGGLVELTTADTDAWQRVLGDSVSHDYYHRADYHQLEEGVDQHACMYVYSERGEFIALPLLLQKLPPALGAPSHCDATSVYGYAGPVVSSPDAGRLLASGFKHHLLDALIRKGAVSVFSRLHPLIDQKSALEGVGEVLDVGETVSVDLGLDPDERRSKYRKNHRRDLRKLRDAGVTCRAERTPEAMAAFQDLYAETMTRLGASERYLFGAEYFESLFTQPGVELLVCRFEDRIVSAGIFLREGPTAQYHLSGTSADFYGRAPLKLMLDHASDWLGSLGVTTLHLGGGVGGHDDALLRFKKGFSDRTHQFSVWQWVVDPETYNSLNPAGLAGGFFPAYRAPTSG